tara:strand:+ start:1937 stop:2410 length:474 start_codon:yes stop_codon:yes gene_type:complete
MYKNFCVIIISAFTLLSCGYSPIHYQNSYFDFTISKFEIEGERDINNFIEKKLERYFNNQSLNKFEVNLVTDYSEIILVKDRKGNSTDIKLVVDINLNYLKITEENKNDPKSLSYTESLTIKKNENNYDQQSYEKIMKKEMTQLILDKIIFELSKEK